MRRLIEWLALLIPGRHRFDGEVHRASGHLFFCVTPDRRQLAHEAVAGRWHLTHRPHAPEESSLITG